MQNHLDSQTPSPGNGSAVSASAKAQAANQADTQADILKTAITLAELLQRVDTSTQAIGAAQYQRLAQHLTLLLAALLPSQRLTVLLNTFPAAAVLYENARYAQAGLCRAPLDASLASELQARNLIGRIRGVSPAR